MHLKFICRCKGSLGKQGYSNSQWKEIVTYLKNKFIIFEKIDVYKIFFEMSWENYDIIAMLIHSKGFVFQMQHRLDFIITFFLQVTINFFKAVHINRITNRMHKTCLTLIFLFLQQWKISLYILHVIKQF